jgi:serine/threonine protein phosphatase 1
LGLTYVGSDQAGAMSQSSDRPIFFAIGDVHGEADKLRALHAAIIERIAFEKARARIVHLGDYVDRGPDSRGVIGQIMAIEAMFEGSPNIRVVSLKGNHEQMMLDAYDAEDGGFWFANGGAETADSYAGGEGLAGANWKDLVPKEHINWMRALPTLWRDEAAKLAFVHAGIDPWTFPECKEEVRMWTRSNNFTDTTRWPKRAELEGVTVVHGHMPVDDPEIAPQRINVDTGACFGGPLTAVVLREGEEPRFLQSI